MSLILASTSRYRRELLSRLQVPFECFAPPFDEEEEKRRLSHLNPRELSLALARGKALSVAALHPKAWVIGSDQICVLDGEQLSKPGSVEAAEEQLRKMRGRTHELITSVVLARGEDEQVLEATDVHRISVRNLDDASISRYVARDLPLDCAGSYKIEALGVALLDRVEGDDATAIVGLPLIALTKMLAEVGLDPLMFG